jgi:hypothetical protein
VTVVLVDLPGTPRFPARARGGGRPQRADGADPRDLVGVARAHRAAGCGDVCVVCDWHWPCPAFFHARRCLIAAGVPPIEWAA